jgi:hypothetical protein
MEENVKNALDSMLLLASSSTVRVRTSYRNIYLVNLISYANRAARFISEGLVRTGLVTIRRMRVRGSVSRICLISHTRTVTSLPPDMARRIFMRWMLKRQSRAVSIISGVTTLNHGLFASSQSRKFCHL